MTKCVTDYLMQEHQELSLLLNDLQQQLGVLGLARDRGQTVERLAGLRRKIIQSIQFHVQEEEQVLYPALQIHVKGIGITLDRMRLEHNAGELAGKTFNDSLDRLLQGKGNPRDVMQTGRLYIVWLRNHLMIENGRLFPMVERGLDATTQQDVRRSMEELTLESTARIAEGQTSVAQA